MRSLALCAALACTGCASRPPEDAASAPPARSKQPHELHELGLIFTFGLPTHVLDTRAGTVTYRRCDEDKEVEIQMGLTDGELDEIRDEVVAMELFDYPDRIDLCTELEPEVCGEFPELQPATDWVFDVSLGDRRKVVTLADVLQGATTPGAPRWSRLFELGKHIQYLLQLRPAWRDRPPHGCRHATSNRPGQLAARSGGGAPPS